MSRPARTLQSADWLDAGMVLALTACALAGWVTTLEGQVWWLVALAAAVVASTSVIGLVGGGSGLIGITALLSAGYLICSGPIARGEVRLAGAAFLGDAFLGTGTAFERIGTTLPPVASAGAVLLAPLLLTLFAVGIGTGLALRSTRPAAPVLPPLIVLIVVLLLGPAQPASVVLQGAVFGVIATVWVLIRSARLEPAAQGAATGAAAIWSRGFAGVAMLALAAMVATAVVGTADPSRFALREHVTGFDASGLETPLDTYRTNTPQGPDTAGNVYDTELLTVTDAPPGLRLRFSVLDSYNGKSWTAGAGTERARGDNRYLRVSSKIATHTGGERIDVGIRPTDAWDRPWVPLAGALRTVEFSAQAADRIDQLRYNPVTASAVMTDRLTEGDYYRFTARLGADKLAATMNPGPDIDLDTHRNAAFLDTPVRAWAGTKLRPMDQLFAIASRLRQVGRYTHGNEEWTARFTAGQSIARLGREFLFSSTTAGDEEQFSAAMALMAARLGIPARVVVGAVVPKTGKVHGRDVTAWVEVQIRDGSWRVLPTSAYTATVPPDPLDALAPPKREFEIPKNQTTDPVKPELPQQREARERAAREAQEFSIRSLVLPVLGGGAVLTLLAIGGMKALRRRRRRRDRRVSLRFAGAWLEIVDQARDLGVPVALTLPRPMQAVAICAGLGADGQSAPDAEGAGKQLSSLDSDLTRLARLADEAIFDPDPSGDAEADSFWRAAMTTRRAMLRRAPWWRRVVAMVSPRSLAGRSSNRGVSSRMPQFSRPAALASSAIDPPPER